MAARRVVITAPAAGAGSTRLSLSDRFSALRAMAAASGAPAGTTARRLDAADRGREARNAKLDARRGSGAAPAGTKGGAAGGAAAGAKGAKKPQQQGQKQQQQAAGKNGNKKQAAGGKKAAGSEKPAKAKPVTKDDLDLQLAQYNHEAGKGPDPKAAKLDTDLETYFGLAAGSAKETPAAGDK